MKIKKIDIVFFAVSFIFFIVAVIDSLSFKKLFYSEITLKYKKPVILQKRECNLSDIGDDAVFLDKAFIKNMNKHKKQKKVFKTIKTSVYAKGNVLYYNGRKYTYYGNVMDKGLKFIFITNSDNKSFIYRVKLYHLIDDTPVKLIGYSEKNITLEYNKSRLVLQNFYVDMKKYQKDSNETKNNK